jgi:hypothetical protein
MQEQKKPGPRLGQAVAMSIAQAAFPRFGVDLKGFELKEALAFQQPNRLDWLFHFQEKRPIAADAYRRISVRVQGNEVTQFTSTVKIPDPFYREANAQTLLNVVFQVLKLVGFLAALSLIVAGFVVAARKNRFPWKRPLRWTAVLAIVPIAAALLRWNSNLFAYDTSIGWDTFISSLVIRLITQIGFQIGLIFLALAGIEAVYPNALDLPRRDARARVGRAALLAALTAIGCVLIRRVLLQIVMLQFPSVAWTNGISVPLAVAAPVPFILGIGEALIRAIEGSAAVALFVAALRGANRPWLPAAAAGLIVFLISLDAGVTAQQTALMLLSAVTAGAVVWLIAEYILRDNLAAYPVTIALVLLLNHAGVLFQNHRADLQIAAFIDIAAAIALAIWVATPRPLAEHA